MTWELVTTFGLAALFAVAGYAVRTWSLRSLASPRLDEIERRLTRVEVDARQPKVTTLPAPDRRFSFK